MTFFAELRVHFEPSIWKEYEDTVKGHPMCPIILSITKEFKRIGSKTLVMPARLVFSSADGHTLIQGTRQHRDVCGSRGIGLSRD